MVLNEVSFIAYKCCNVIIMYESSFWDVFHIKFFFGSYLP
jgi:hypothetical protein